MRLRDRKPWWKLRSWQEVLEWRKQTDEKHRGSNKRVDSRQVLRQKHFQASLADINQQYGGEPRKIRRAIARVISKRHWMESVKELQ